MAYSQLPTAHIKDPKTGLGNKNCVTDLNIADKRILLEADLNVPIKSNKVCNNHKIIIIIPTIKYLLDQGCRSIILINNFEHSNEETRSKYSLQPVAAELQSILFTCYKKSVIFLKNIFDPTIESLCSNPPSNSIFLIENVQFSKEEFKYIYGSNHTTEIIDGKAIEFRKLMKKFADNLVIEAFFLSYHTKSFYIGPCFPYRMLGLHAKRELSAFRHMFREPFRPFIAVIGGICTEYKLKVILNMLKYVDGFIIGGAISLIFLKQTGKMKICENESDMPNDTVQLVNEIIRKALSGKKPLFLPWDFKIAQNIESTQKPRNVSTKYEIPRGYQACDIGSLSSYHFPRIIEKAQTILLYGTLGITENVPFQEGTTSAFKAIAERTEWGALSIIIGENTISFAKKTDFCHKFSHMSISKEARRLLQGEEVCALSFIRNIKERYSWGIDTSIYNLYEEERSKSMKDSPFAVRLPDFVNILTRPETNLIDPVCGEYLCPFSFPQNWWGLNNQNVQPDSSKQSSDGFVEGKSGTILKMLITKNTEPSNSSNLRNQQVVKRKLHTLNMMGTTCPKKKKSKLGNTLKKVHFVDDDTI